MPERNRLPLDWRPTERRYACVAVEDDGDGIAPRDIEAVRSVLLDEVHGRGMGLSVVLGLVRTHGGAVGGSTPGRGSAFPRLPVWAKVRRRVPLSGIARAAVAAKSRRDPPPPEERMTKEELRAAFAKLSLEEQLELADEFWRGLRGDPDDSR